MTDSEYTHIAIIADRSGSMHGIHTDMNGAILELLANQAKEPGYCLVDVTTFDDKIERPFFNVRPDDVKGTLIEPRGSTALNDAMGRTIIALGERFKDMAEGDRPGKVIVVVVTDGMENASKEFSTKQIRSMIEEQTNQWGWTFMYLAANVDVDQVVGDYGFSPKMSSGYVATAGGVGKMSKGLHSNMSRVRAGDSSGWTDEEREDMNTQ